MAPMIGAVTPGLWSSQASATCAGATPRSVAMSTTRSTTSKSVGWLYRKSVSASVSERVVRF